ncbi:hypothetical protein ACFV7Q_28175 [Streptomyces sp. NPDC059851]|uniref:hypothetical protein n=1 Tax=Streptomyces sp. NPDC059851 TaxID=3346971 RepID=UPI00364B879F
MSWTTWASTFTVAAVCECPRKFHHHPRREHGGGQQRGCPVPFVVQPDQPEAGALGGRVKDQHPFRG